MLQASIFLFDNSWGDIHADFTFRMHPIEGFNQTIDDDVIVVWWWCFFYFLDLVHNDAMIKSFLCLTHEPFFESSYTYFISQILIISWDFLYQIIFFLKKTTICYFHNFSVSCFLSSDIHQSYHLDGCQAIGKSSFSICASWVLRFW